MLRLLPGALCVLLAACSAARPPPAAARSADDLEARRQALAGLIAEQWEYVLRTSPEFASVLGDKRYNDRWSDLSEEAVFADLEQARRFATRFEALDPAGLPVQEALSRTLMLRRLRRDLESAPFEDWLMPVNQFNGLHLGLPQLVTLLAFDSVKDYDDYLARLETMPAVFDQLLVLLRKGMAKGLMPPRILLEKVPKQAEGVIAGKQEESPFAQPLKKFPAAVPEAERQRLRAAVLKAIEGRVAPTYRTFIAFVRDQYAPAGRAEPGVWSLPQGEARYAFLVKDNTTTAMTPDEIHRLGLAEVARIEGELLAIANQLGYGDLKAFNAAVEKDPALRPASRQAMLDLYQKYTDQMTAQLPRLFGRLPKARLEIHQVEEFREKEFAGAQYNQGTPDGARPGHVLVNTGGFQERKTLNIETTAYHEGVPGHHLQISIAQELPQLPPFRQQYFVTAYVEGWALYSERLGREAGFFQDRYSLYGHLQDEMLRAVRLVVDTGFHSRRWTRQQVIDFFHAHTNQDETDVQAETDRYIAIPGQALGYKIGQLKILALRERARQALGTAFDVRGFHDVVLGAGALPLDVLEQQIEGWIAARKAANRVAARD